MSTIKVDTVKNRSSAINLPNNFKIGGLSIIQGYTSSGSEPSSPSTGDFWWDSSNDKLYRYINGEFKEISLAAGGPAFMGTRGLIMGGQGPASVYASNDIQYVTIATPGNATDFGDLTRATYFSASHSNGSRIVKGGGTNNNSPYYFDDIDYFAAGTTGNASDFGNLTEARGIFAGGGDLTRTLFGGGMGVNHTGAPNNRKESRTIDYITTANTGNATDFGDLSYYRDYATATSDATRTVFAAGEDYSTGSNAAVNIMEYVTTQTTGNVTDFGDLSVAGYSYNSGVCASLTRGIFMGGYGSSRSNHIDYITIQTTGNATDFGDMLTANLHPATPSDGTTGIIAGGSRQGGETNVIEKITIATPGNATDFGDLLAISGAVTYNAYQTGASGT
tara:strand:+ start:1070 stop:2242 length:1173 start_codon:yes stop_codon:yes gene_type:complete